MTHRIILDTDPGVDDAMALMLALRSPEIEVAGITTVFGNSTVEATTRNALNLLDVADRADIPVAAGADHPLVGVRHGTAEWVHGEDAMGGIGWTRVNRAGMRALDVHAAEFIVAQARAHPGAITLVPIGPLTNIALALQLEPRLPSMVRQVVMMGGTVLHPGNVSPVAEANIRSDPHAAAAVFSAPWQVTMAGLDVTESVEVDNTLWTTLRDSGDPLGGFLAKAVAFYQHFHHSWYGMLNGAIYMHDACVIAWLVDPTLFEAEDYAISVPLEGPAIAATIADRRGRFYKTPKVRCLMRADGQRLLALFRDRLARQL